VRALSEVTGTRGRPAGGARACSTPGTSR
jgi:hypothetical protein